MIQRYAGDRKFEKAEGRISIRISFQESMSLSDLAGTLEDIESIFNTSAREVQARAKHTINQKKSGGRLIIQEFRAGSLEIIADPYFSGVVSGLAANTVFSLFIYALKRINGKPNGAAGASLDGSNDALSQDKARDAANRIVTYTANPRRRLKAQIRTFGLRISVKTREVWEDTIED